MFCLPPCLPACLQLAQAAAQAPVPVGTYLPPAEGLPGFCLYRPDEKKTPAIRAGVIKADPDFYQFALVGAARGAWTSAAGSSGNSSALQKLAVVCTARLGLWLAASLLHCATLRRRRLLRTPRFLPRRSLRHGRRHSCSTS